MTRIQIIYKPLLALKPIHLALVGVLEQRCETQELPERLPLLSVVLDYILEELVSWQLVTNNGTWIALTPQGKKCLEVWTTTHSMGYWEIAEDGEWLLGQGTFELPTTLPNLHSAGFDIETGQTLNEIDALKTIRSQQSQIHRLQGDELRATWVIFAQWLSQRDGLLGKLANESPGALRVVSVLPSPSET